MVDGKCDFCGEEGEMFSAPKGEDVVAASKREDVVAAKRGLRFEKADDEGRRGFVDRRGDDERRFFRHKEKKNFAAKNELFEFLGKIFGKCAKTLDKS